MSRDYEWCLRKKRIVKQEFAEELVDPELSAARADLETARKTFEVDFKWATIQAYYSMFHAARAMLFSKGYREKSHACLKAAIKALCVDTGELETDYLADFDATMLLRETADYKNDFSKEGAEASIECATKFLKKAEEILA